MTENQTIGRYIFLQYYFITLCFLGFVGFLIIGSIVFNLFVPIPLTDRSSIPTRLQVGQKESVIDQEKDYSIQNYSGETLTYDVNLKVANVDGRLVQTYIFEYKN